jgi:cell division septum initiation protein DivIVA
MPKLPEFKDWKAPWEKSETEFNADVARKFIYDLHKDVEKGAEEISTLKTQNSELQTKVTETEKANMTEAEKAAHEKAELEKKLASAGEKDLEVTRLELALEHGLTKSQAKRLVGKTAEELTADAEALIEDLGLKKDESNNPDGEQTPDGRTRPRRLQNPLNPQGGDTGISTEQLLKELPRI